MLRPLTILMVGLAALSGCIGETPVTEDPDSTPPGPPHTVDDLSPMRFEVGSVQEEWVTMSDGERIHNAVYRPATEEPVPVFINFSPYWGDTAEIRGDAFSQYMIDEYVPRGYAVVLSSIRGTGHSEGCFQIGGDRESQDLQEVVDHYAEQEWSNGKIMAGGKSYDSTSQNGMIAKFPSDNLVGVFHVSGITDMYRYNYREGVTYTSGLIFNTYYYLQGTDEYGVSLVGAGGPGNEGPESLARIIDDAACTEFPPMQASGVGSGVTGIKDAYWQERDWNAFIGNSDWEGSIFFVHGLQDWNVKPDHIMPWLDELPEGIETIGWLHQWTEGGTGHVYPMRPDWNITMLRWMDHISKGIDTGLFDEPRFQSMADDGNWYASNTWPPTAANDTVESGTAISIDATGMRLTGSPSITVKVRPSSADAVATAIFYAEDSAGQRVWLTEAVKRVLLRDGLDNPQPYLPDFDEVFELEAYPVDHVFQDGHKLVVEFGGEPRYPLILPGQMDVMYLGYEDHDIRLVPASEGLVNPQPGIMRCFAC